MCGSDPASCTSPSDGGRFQHILNYLRNGTVKLDDSIALHEQILEEAEFFCLQDLVDDLRGRISRLQSQSGAQQRGLENIRTAVHELRRCGGVKSPPHYMTRSQAAAAAGAAAPASASSSRSPPSAISSQASSAALAVPPYGPLVLTDDF